MGRRLETLAAVTCLKTLLMIFNILFWISGIIIICIGIWAKVSLYIYTQLSTNNYAFTPYLLIGIGALIISVGTLGCCCTAKGNTRFLYVYSAVLLLIFILEMIAGISFYAKRHKIANGFKLGLNHSLEHYPQEDQKSIDYLQKALHCCGISNYTDCCCSISPNDCMHSSLPDDSTIVGQNIYTQGCHDKVIKFVNDHMAAIGATELSIAFFNILGLLLSYYLAKTALKAEYENLDTDNN
ncbi:unnamed protein product [Gordionus sp. m RMFG-2023]